MAGLDKIKVSKAQIQIQMISAFGRCQMLCHCCQCCKVWLTAGGGLQISMSLASIRRADLQ